MGVGQPMGSLAQGCRRAHHSHKWAFAWWDFFALPFFCIPLASNLTLATSLMLFCSVHGVAASFE